MKRTGFVPVLPPAAGPARRASRRPAWCPLRAQRGDGDSDAQASAASEQQDWLRRGFAELRKAEERQAARRVPRGDVMSHTLVDRDAQTGLYPRDRAVYVDESTCIGCTHCATTAHNTFFMQDDHGRARVFRQDGDKDDLVEEAIDTCPVNCIWYVSWEDLEVLEKERQTQKIDNFKRLVGGQSPEPNDSRAEVMRSAEMRCENCPMRGCAKCPLYGVGENPAYLEKVRARAEAKAKRSPRDRRAV